jgi:hypothetical protein
MGRTKETLGEVVLKGALNSDGVLVTQRDQNLNATEGWAATTPPSGKAHYAVGCRFTDTANGAVYYNTGSVTSCTFTMVGTVAAGSVVLANLATGIAPSHVVKFAGKHTTAGGSATEAFTVTGVAATDIVVATLQTKGASPQTIVTTAPTLNTITVVFSADPSTDHVVSYVVYRAAS